VLTAVPLNSSRPRRTIVSATSQAQLKVLFDGSHEASGIAGWTP
jgi:hypothetical protein